MSRFEEAREHRADTLSAIRWDSSLDRATNTRRAEALIDAVLGSDSMECLARAWNATAPASMSVRERLVWFQLLSRQHWDSRDGRERRQSRALALTNAQLDAIAGAVRSLGLDVATQPIDRRFDHTIILGARVGATLARTAYATELAAQGIDLGAVTALAALRPVDDRESLLAGRLGLTVETEFDASAQSLCLNFGLGSTPDINSGVDHRTGGTWVHAAFPGHPIRALAAPMSSHGARRADTSDTLHWWAERVRPQAGARVLVITSMLYVPYQAALVARILGAGAGLSVETVGYLFSPSAHWAIDPGPGPTDQLQEIRSMIIGFGSLLDEIGIPSAHGDECTCGVCVGRAAREVIAQDLDLRGDKGLAWVYRTMC